MKNDLWEAEAARSISIAELYSSLPVEKRIEYNAVFTELQTSLSVNLDNVAA